MRSALPTVVSPSFSNEPAHQYDHLRKGDPEVEDPHPAFSTPHKLLVGVVPGFGAFHHPTFFGLQQGRFALHGDLRAEATGTQFLTGSLRAVAAVKVHLICSSSGPSTSRVSRQVHLANGHASYHAKAVSEETGGEYSLYETTAPSQLGAPPYIHHRETEAFYVLEGEFEFLKGERAVRAGVGEFVHVPRGVVHGFTNVGDKPARLLGIVTLGGLHEKMLTEIGEQAKSETLPPPSEGPPDMADMERITQTALKYGTELLPPSGQ
jgi:mannose-6-phosphate isomerase-like protein (cupin superfamily)